MSSLHDRIQRQRTQQQHSKLTAAESKSDAASDVRSVSTTGASFTVSASSMRERILQRNLAKHNDPVKSPSFDSLNSSEASSSLTPSHLQTIAQRKAALLKQRRRQKQSPPRKSYQTVHEAKDDAIEVQMIDSEKDEVSTMTTETPAAAQRPTASVDYSAPINGESKQSVPSWKKSSANPVRPKAPPQSRPVKTSEPNENPWRKTGGISLRASKPPSPSRPAPIITEPTESRDSPLWKRQLKAKQKRVVERSKQTPGPSWAKPANESSKPPSTVSAPSDEGRAFAAPQNVTKLSTKFLSNSKQSAQTVNGTANEKTASNAADEKEEKPNPWKKLQARKRRVPVQAGKPLEKKEFASWIKPAETTTQLDTASQGEEKSIHSVQTGVKSEPVRPVTGDMKLSRALWSRSSKLKESASEWTALNDSTDESSAPSWTGSPVKKSGAPSWAKPNKKQGGDLSSPRSVGSGKSASSWIKPKTADSNDERTSGPFFPDSEQSQISETKATAYRNHISNLSSPRSIHSASSAASSWTKESLDRTDLGEEETFSPTSQQSALSEALSVSDLASPRSVGSSRSASSWIKPRTAEDKEAGDTLSPDNVQPRASDTSKKQLASISSPRSISSGQSAPPWAKSTSIGGGNESSDTVTPAAQGSQTSQTSTDTQPTPGGLSPRRAKAEAWWIKTSRKVPNDSSSEVLSPSNQQIKDSESRSDTQLSTNRFPKGLKASPLWARPESASDEPGVSYTIGPRNQQGTSFAGQHASPRAAAGPKGKSAPSWLKQKPAGTGHNASAAASDNREPKSADEPDVKVTYGGAVIETPKASNVAAIRAAFQKGQVPVPTPAKTFHRLAPVEQAGSRTQNTSSSPAQAPQVRESAKPTSDAPRSPSHARLQPSAEMSAQRKPSPGFSGKPTPRISNQQRLWPADKAGVVGFPSPPVARAASPIDTTEAPAPASEMSPISLEKSIADDDDDAGGDAATEVSVPISLTQMAADSAFAIDFDQLLSESGRRMDSFDDEASQLSSGTGVGKAVPAMKDLPEELRKIVQDSSFEQNPAKSAHFSVSMGLAGEPDELPRPTKVSFSNSLPHFPTDEASVPSHDGSGGASSFDTDWPATDDEPSFSPKTSFEVISSGHTSSRGAEQSSLEKLRGTSTERVGSDAGSSSTAIFGNPVTFGSAGGDVSDDAPPVAERAKAIEGWKGGRNMHEAQSGQDFHDYDANSPGRIASPDADEIPMDYGDEIGAFPSLRPRYSPQQTPLYQQQPAQQRQRISLDKPGPERGILRRERSSDKTERKAVRFSEHILAKLPPDDDSRDSDRDQPFPEVPSSPQSDLTTSKQELDFALANGDDNHAGPVDEQATRGRSSDGASNVLQFWAAPTKDELDEAAVYADRDPDLGDMEESLTDLRDMSPSPDLHMVPSDDSSDLNALKGWHQPFRSQSDAFDPFGGGASDEEESAFDFERRPEPQGSEESPPSASDSHFKTMALKPPRRSPASHNRVERLKMQQAYDDYYARQALYNDASELDPSRKSEDTLEI